MASNEGNTSNGEPVVISELLCYATFNMKRSTTEQIVKVIYRFYDIDEIIDAKKVLYHKFPQLGDYPTRKTSINRSEQEAHTIDIVESLVELDSQGINVIFVAKNLNRVPKCDPHETDHISILEKIRKLEGRLNSAENELSENKVQILNMSDKFVKIDSRVISCEKNMLDMATIGVEKDTSYSTIVKSSFDHKRPPAREPIELRGPQDKSSARCKLVSGGGARGDGGADGIWGPPEGVDDPGDGASQKTEDKTDNTDGFTLQRDQVRREKRRQRSRAVVTGTSGIGNFRGGPPPLRDFFLYRVMKPATADDVAECLRSHEIKCDSVLRVSNEEARFCSFKLSIPITDIKKVMEPDVWPEGVRIRKFTSRPNNGGRE